MAEFRLPTKLQLTLVTRDRKVLETEVDEVVMPASGGYLGVLPGHTPLLATLKIGELTYRIGNKQHHLAISWGFAAVLPDRVIILADAAFRPEEVDRVEAERQKKLAEKELMSLASHDEGFALAEARLEESIAMINITSRRLE